MTPLVPSALCGLAVALAVPTSAGALLGKRIPAGGESVAPPRALQVRLAGLLTAGLVAGLVLGGGRPVATTLPLAASGLLVVGVAMVLLRRSRSASRARSRRAGVIEACDALAAGLRAGQPPLRVLERVAADVDTLRPAAAAARLGGDVAAALRTASRLDGGEGLSSMAAAWTVAQRSGAGLAEVVSRVAATVRAEAEQRRKVDVALGTSRSTARLLAGLPLMGVALGSGIDADPLHVLFGSPVGAWCLLVGTALAAAGVLWVERLADGALR